MFKIVILSTQVQRKKLAHQLEFLGVFLSKIMFILNSVSND